MSKNNFAIAIMSDKIQVAIKVRPLVARERDVGEFWRVNGNELHLLNNDKQLTGEIFAFDHVFPNNSTNMEVFEKVVKSLVNRAVKGFNATIFAYGQTSSGKTHTMLGDQNEAGITQLAISAMFDFMKKSEGREFLVRASYMEIYNEKVNDLLEQQNNNLKIREEDGKIVVQRLKEELVADTAKVMSLLKRGQKIRRIGETNLNERSSRSHTIFRLIIESRESDMGDDGTIQVSQLNLVDLAGSERAGLAGTTGERLKEGCAINRSLFQLSQVVAQLSEGSQFVNFRDSKLTRILQCSLGGNAHTLIICTVTPASVEFTLSTLGFASRAKSVKNKPQVNEVMSDGTLIKKYARQLEKLQAELKAAKERNSCHELEAVESKLEEQERLNSELQRRINILMKTLIVAESVPKPRFNRRRTWGGGQLTHLDLQKGSLLTIEEEDTSLVLTNDDFNTPYEDFEVQLIEDEREKGIEMDILPNSETSISLGNCSFGSSIHSTRVSRNFSPSRSEECKEVQTSSSIMCTPVRHHMATNTTPPSANSLYWAKENCEHRSFVHHEHDIILGLENQLEFKEKELEELQKSLTEKEKILNNTLSFQESLTMKLIEYEQALEKTQKENKVYSNKIDAFHKDNKDLKMQIQELKVQNKVNNDQIASFKERLFQEVVSLNPNRSSQITNTSEPNEIFNVLMNCIMEKQMEIISQFQCQNIESLHKSPEHLDSNILEEENSQLRAALQKLQQEQVECNEKCISFQKTMAELEMQVEQLEVHNEELKTQLDSVYQEKYSILQSYANIEVELTNKNDKRQENLALELFVKENGKESELECIESACEEQGESKWIEKVKVLEDHLKQVTVQNTELQQHIEKVEKENVEKVMNLEKTIKDTYIFEKQLDEQAGIIKEIEEDKRALEQNVCVFETELKEKNELLCELETRMCSILSRSALCDKYVQIEHEEKEPLNILKEVLPSGQNVSEEKYEMEPINKEYADQEEKLSTIMEKVSILERQLQEDSLQREELQQQIEKLEKERAESTLALDKALEDKCSLEEKVEEQTSIINSIKEANIALELFVKENGKESELECIESACEEQGESKWIEKVKVLEDHLKQVTVQNTELQQQIEKVEKEYVENVMNLERTIKDKYSLEKKLDEQAGIIKEIEEDKRALEQNVCVFETELKEKNELLCEFKIHMCSTLSRNALCDKYVQTEPQENEPQNVLKEVLPSGGQNVSEEKYEMEPISKQYADQEEKLSALIEKVSILESQLQEDSLQREELQQQIEKLEKERAESTLALDKVLEDKWTSGQKLDQARVINGSEEANGTLEHFVLSDEKDSELEHTQKICEELACTEKVKVLEDHVKQVTLQNTELRQKIEKMENGNIKDVMNMERTVEDKYSLEEKLEKQAGIIKEIEETKRVLEKKLSVFETELKEKNELLKDLERCMCSTRRNVVCDKHVLTDLEVIEHQNVLEEDLPTGSKNMSEKEYEMEPVNKLYADQEEKLSTLMEKVSILESRLEHDSLQREELQLQIEKLEKESAENSLTLENALADKFALETRVQEQFVIIQEIEKSKVALEICVNSIESEKKHLLLEIQQLRNSNSAECVQMNLLVTSPHNDNLKESLSLDSHNTSMKELLVENMQEKCGNQDEKLFAFTEKIRILEEQCRQSSEQVEKLQFQITIRENEKVENSMKLEKALWDKCSLEEKIADQGLIIKEYEKNNFILQNHIRDLETELKVKKELILVLQEEKCELENQLCSTKDKISSSVVDSEHAKELEMKLNKESECKREKELELAHLKEKLIEQDKQLYNLAANEKVLEDQLQLVGFQKEEMQHKIEILEKNILECDLNLQNILKDKIALVEKVDELNKILKDTEESKTTMMMCINNLESELIEKNNLLLELQEHKNEIEKHSKNLEETVKMKIETFETIKMELENNLKKELEYRTRQEKCISQYENELIELRHKLSASAENLKVLKEELQRVVLNNKDMKSQINELEKCNVECEIKLERTIEEKQFLEKRIGEQISDFEESKTSLQQCVHKLEKELSDKKTIILGMGKQKSELEDKYAILESQIETAEKEKLELEDKLKEISNSKREVERELAFMQKKLCEKERLFNDMLQEVKDLEEQFKKEEELKKEMQKQLTTLLESKSSCEKQLNIEIEQRENIASKLSEVTCRCTQQERTMKELENKNASMEEQLQDLENYRSMEEVVKILKIQHNEEVICKENMKEDLMSKEEELVQCKKQIQELNNIIDSLKFDNRVRETMYNSQLQDLEEERMKLVETSKVQCELESKLKDEVQCLQERLSKQEEKLMKVQEQLQISVNVTIKDNVIKQELLFRIQSLEDENKEYELRLKKATEERKQLQLRLSDLGKRTAQQDERAKECDKAQVDLAEMLQSRERKLSWNGDECVKGIELNEISDSRKLCQEYELKIQRLTTERDYLVAENTNLKHFDTEHEQSLKEIQNSLQSQTMQSKYARRNESFDLPLQNIKKQLNDEIKAKTDLENKLLIMQNELTAAKTLEQELHQEMENIKTENTCLRKYVKDLDEKKKIQRDNDMFLRQSLKTLFRIFRVVVQEQESPVEKLDSIIYHLRAHGISVPSESSFEKEKLESKIAELEKSIESLHETLRKEGYHYSSPHWVRMGECVISNGKIKQLEKRNKELQEEVEMLKSNKGSSASDEGLMDNTLFRECLKSPPLKHPECMKCEALKKQVGQLTDESAMKSMQINSLTYELKLNNSDFYKNKAEVLDQKSKALIQENKKLRHNLETFEAEAKKRNIKRHQESQTDSFSVPWDRLRAMGSGSKVADDHVIDKLNETIKRLTNDKEQLKKVARELKKRYQELEVEKQSTSTGGQTSRRVSSPATVTPRRRAALQRLVRDANEIVAEQRQSHPCTHHQRNKENPCHLPEQK